MKKKVTGFGIIGTGLIAEFHAKAIEALDNTVLIGVFNRHPERAVQFAQKFNCRVYESLHDMANDPAVEVVCICTASGAHMEPALICMEAGKHCLVEKPLEVTLDRCDRMIQAAKSAGVMLAVIFPARFYEVNKQIKEAVMQNRIGTPVMGNAYVKWHRSEAYYASASWRGTWKLDGGGALMNQGIHSVDLLLWFMGPAASVYAVTANRVHKEIEVEDTVVATIRFASGAVGTIECSTAVFPGTFRRLEVMGADGTAIAEENDLCVWKFRDESERDEAIRKQFSGAQISQGGVSDPAAISFKGHQLQIEDMLHAIETGSSPLVDGPEGRRSVELVLAIYKSARTGQTIQLP